MKRKLVAFMLIMAVCANLHTTVFAARETTWSEEEADNAWQPDTLTQDTTPSATAPSEETTDGNTDTGATEDSKVTEVPVETGKDEPINDIISISGGTTVIEGGNTETTTDTVEENNTATVGTENSGASVTIGVKEDKETPVGTDSNLDKNGNAEIKNTSGEMVVNVKEDTKDKEDDKEPEEKDEKTLRNEKIQQELKNYAKSIGFTDNRRYGKDAVTFNHEYAEKPVIGEDSCVAGKLADSTLKEGLDLINMIRKTAGLGEVTLDDTYNEYAQNGALIMKASENTVGGGLSHNPVKVDNTTKEQQDLGHLGTRNGNIGLGHTSLTDTILNGYMYDGDRNNIAAMGHRRWILNPTMGKVGFGQVDGYNCMYAHDNSNPDEKIEDFVTWPAENMPIELMTYCKSESLAGTTASSMPWTCQLGTNYRIAPSTELTITVTYPDGHEYTIPQKNVYCNNQKYGYTNGCITFDARDFDVFKTSSDDFTKLGNNYSVKIDGVLDKNGNKTSIEYDVNFFNLF